MHACILCIVTDSGFTVAGESGLDTFIIIYGDYQLSDQNDHRLLVTQSHTNPHVKIFKSIVRYTVATIICRIGNIVEDRSHRS